MADKIIAKPHVHMRRNPKERVLPAPQRSFDYKKFTAWIASKTEIELLVTLSTFIRTYEGAERIFKAEQLGQNRPSVLAAAAQKMDELVHRPKLDEKED